MRSGSNTRYYPIQDYAIIGDSRCAALVSRYGAIDWLCLPRFASPAVFGALLDADKGGTFQIWPSGDFDTRRNYIEDTNVLETVFSTASGEVRLTDSMPVYGEDYMRRRLCPQRQVLRKIKGLQGEVAIEVIYRPRAYYGKRAYLKKRNALGIYCEVKDGTMILGSDVTMSLSEEIESFLGKNGLIYRYTFDDGLPPGEGAFGACSFWAVECAARRGELRQAKQRFAHLLKFANDVGLYSEEIDVDSGAALGNFPQAFTHVALINAAMAISPREMKKEPK